MKRMLLKIARMSWVGAAIGFFAERAPFLIPLRRVYADKYVICFMHPVPAYAFHALILPRKRVRTVFDITDNTLYDRVLSAAGQLAKLAGRGELVLCVNGGGRQEVAQVHFHLYSPRTNAAAPGNSRVCNLDKLSETLVNLNAEHGIAAKGFSVKFFISPGGGFTKTARVEWK